MGLCEESADGSADYWNSATSKDNQKKLVSFAFKERPFIASLMLKHYHEMAVVRELLNGQETWWSLASFLVVWLSGSTLTHPMLCMFTLYT